MRTGKGAVALVVAASVFGAAAQVVFKIASEKFSISVKGTILNLELVLGFALLFIVAVMFLAALKSGELTVLYPLLAMTYVWVAIASPFIFETDSINLLKIAGITSIIMGTYFIGKGMQHKVEVI